MASIDGAAGSGLLLVLWQEKGQEAGGRRVCQRGLTEQAKRSDVQQSLPVVTVVTVVA